MARCSSTRKSVVAMGRFPFRGCVGRCCAGLQSGGDVKIPSPKAGTLAQSYGKRKDQRREQLACLVGRRIYVLFLCRLQLHHPRSQRTWNTIHVQLPSHGKDDVFVGIFTF